MLNPLGRYLHIGLAADGIALASVSRWGRDRADLLAECSFDGARDYPSIGAQLTALMEATSASGQMASVVLSDEFIRTWVVTPPACSTRQTDIEAAAVMRFQTLFGSQSTGWKMSADWGAANPFLAAAIPASLLEQLELSVRQRRIRLVEIVPDFVASLNRWRKKRVKGGWFGTVLSGILRLALFDNRRLVAILTAAVPADADRSWLDAVLSREALRMGLRVPSLLQMSGQVSQCWIGASAASGTECVWLDDGIDERLSAAARLALGSRGTA